MARLQLALFLLLLPLVLTCDLCERMDNMGSMGNMQQMSWQQQQMMQQMMMQQQMGMGQWPQNQGWGGWGDKPQPQQPQRPQQPSGSGCQGFADVVLLLDSSGSIGEENFRKQLDFVSQVVGSFQLSNQARRGYQFGVLSFSQSVKEEFPLNKYYTIRELRDAIRNIPFMGQNTDTHKALEYALRTSFQSNKGGRNGAVKIVLVITDGRSNVPAETESMVVTIDLGGGVSGGGQGGGRTWTMQDYMRWKMEQELMKKEQESARMMLEAIETAQKNERERREKREHREEEMEAMVTIEGKMHEAVAMKAHFEQMSYKAMEMKHHFYFMVTSEMIKMCPLGDHRDDVMLLMMHGVK
ncbi:collagen alpha-1(xii) chain [Plakobranchus ocellatus]|uniref:Collagen alpha-1(Xii) chain n=1 Tax=Plakobranchus ocellatus TaxID=259542 RepID=A0AAV4BM48_9GAST|nr:collagen alpha-1(xii) chain [Plakobranchus ocellatus]